MSHCQSSAVFIYFIFYLCQGIYDNRPPILYCAGVQCCSQPSQGFSRHVQPRVSGIQIVEDFLCDKKGSSGVGPAWVKFSSCRHDYHSSQAVVRVAERNSNLCNLSPFCPSIHLSVSVGMLFIPSILEQKGQ